MAKKDEEDKKIISIEDFNEEIIKIVNKKDKAMYKPEDTEKPSNVGGYISTGSTILDYQLANQRYGGIPIGRITSVSGDSSSGKSLLAFQIIANAQKMRAPVFYADTERASDERFMKRVGVQLDKLPPWYPKSLEDFFEQTEKIIIKTREAFPDKERPVLIVLDSVAATPCEVENENNYDANARMGVLGKTLSLGLKKITQIVGSECVTVLLLNQLRMKINAMRFEDPFVEPGGKAAEFYTSVRMRLHKKAKVKDPITNEILGVGCLASIKKNKLAPAHREAYFNLMFDRGIDDEGSVFEFLKEREIVRKRSNGNTIFEGDKCGINFEKEFPSNSWRSFHQENEEMVLDVLDKLLIKEYTDTSNLNTEQIVVEKEE